MRKSLIIGTIFAAIILVCFIACTDNNRVKKWGGSADLELPKGQKLINITWKEEEIWYLSRPMTDKDTAQTYTFQEKSNWGISEGTFTIKEIK